MVFFAKGRAAWIAALAFGILMVIGGAVIPSSPNMFVIVAGALFGVFGLVFLILSFATGGATD